MLTTARGKPLRRLPYLNLIRKSGMAKTLTSPPEIIFAERDGFAVAQANPGAVVVDREAGVIRRDRLFRRLRAPRMFRLADHILTMLPRTDLSREAMLEAAGIADPHDLSVCLRQVRHNLQPFGVGITTAHGGWVFITEAEAAAC